MQDIVTYKGSLYFKEGEDAKPKALPGSCIAFTKNGELQGTAFRSAAAVPHISTGLCLQQNLGVQL